MTWRFITFLTDQKNWMLAKSCESSRKEILKTENDVQQTPPNEWSAGKTGHKSIVDATPNEKLDVQPKFGVRKIVIIELMGVKGRMFG